MKSPNRLTAPVRMSAAIWASQNKANLDGKTLKQIADLVAKGIGLNGKIALSTMRTIAESAKLQPKERGEKQSADRARNGIRIRRLATHLKNLYLIVGADVPEDVMALANGNAEVPAE